MHPVVLVDRDDVAVGTAEKMQAHRDGLLHRAFSVFVFRPDGSMLLQRRALSKYHSGGLWTNTCCSHPWPGEEVGDAARRRLREEMGFDCELSHAFSFIYRAELDGGLHEHELDHVFVGRSDRVPDPDPEEVDSWREVWPDDLRREMDADPERFTVWFRIALPALLEADPTGMAPEWRPIPGFSSLLEV